ncbi:PTS sugar transporter subunit IIA [Brachybacterium sp. EF45031]|uniref:PTS sugar transporter subunit IIA n=1 Tax=Brachybacterium sillae TaxID=2810536 RepID=UPI00217D6B88|nr:PTS sugar transporter subunit IIA [Brachybacterium sillae]MCS6711547.1 PTS sugar transporter subunit IIA [Brachybacterium sillae]
MTTTAPGHTETGRSGASPRVLVQKVGTALSSMVMPNIPALIAWGLITALFIPVGWMPNEALSSIVGPMIHYLLPLLIANTAGRMVYDARGAVVGVTATMGVIAGSDWLIQQENTRLLADWVAAGNAEADFAPLGQVHMFIGAMMMAPFAAWAMKQLDRLWADRIPAGFEMLVNMFSAGIWGTIAALLGFFALAPVINAVMAALSAGVAALVGAGLLPLVSLLIEPAKVFFLNNAINHGVLTPLGTQEAGEAGKSILFLLEANPGPGLGILLAWSIFGRGAARASAPGAAIIHFFGGIHEIYFPYVLMRPLLIIAAIAGGMTGVFLNVLFGNGLVGPAAPGSIIAVMTMAARGDQLTVLLSVLGAALVSFLVAALLLRLGRKDRDDDLAAATARMEEMKGKKSSVAGALTGAGAAGSVAAAAAASGATGPIRRIVFACDAGMGSSAMGATVLRKKVRAAGFDDVEVTNKSIASLSDEWDVVVTQKELTPRAAQRTGSAVQVSVDNFMNSPRYDEVVELIRERSGQGAATADGPAEPAPVAAATAPTAATTGSHRAEPTPTQASSAPGAEAPADGAATEVLPLSSIVLGGVAASADDAIDEAGGLLVRAGAVEDGYVAAMHDRESTVSTFMGNGLAIPHGTHEAKESILRSGMSLVRYDREIDWNGNPVRYVVGIAGRGDEHLALLQSVALIFADPAQVARLDAATTPQEVRALFDEQR